MTLENVRHSKVICSRDTTHSEYYECEDGLLGFQWEVAQSFSSDRYRIQFDGNTGKLVYGSAIVYDDTPDRSVLRAGSPRSGADCRSCRICSPDDVDNGGAGGVPNVGPGEDCVFDENGRIGLPPIED